MYSSGAGRVCPRCGHPAERCACSTATAADEPVPDRITAKLRVEKKGRAGKTVTVVDGLPRNQAFLRGLAQELKSSCGTGGSVGEGAIELQGDRRERLRELLKARGYTVRG